MKTNPQRLRHRRLLDHGQVLGNLIVCAACLAFAARYSSFGQESNPPANLAARAAETAKTLEGKPSELDGILRLIEVPAFHVTEAETAAVLGLAQRYLGDLSSRELPAFAIHLAPETLIKKISVHVSATTAIDLLKEIAAAAGAELHTEGNVIAFSSPMKPAALAEARAPAGGE